MAGSAWREGEKDEFGRGAVKSDNRAAAHTGEAANLAGVRRERKSGGRGSSLWRRAAVVLCKDTRTREGGGKGLEECTGREVSR